MMKKLLTVTVLVGMVVWGVAGMAGATLYTQSADNIGVGGEYIDGRSSYSYSFDTPALLTVPGDTVTLANLVLTGTPDTRVGTTEVTVGGKDFGLLENFGIA